MRLNWIVALASILAGAGAIAAADELRVGRASAEITPAIGTPMEGAYEAAATRCAPGSGERLVEAATRLLIKLKAGGRG
jgi:hypothetical protein